MRSQTLPAFVDDRKLRLFLGTLLYLAQGFPQGVVFYAIPNWLAVNEQGAAVVGMAAAAASMPWMAKWAVGAFIDRYTYLPMGRRRPWLIGAQVGIAIAFLSFALVAPSADETKLVVGFCFMVSSLTAIQDVALDALVIDLTPDHEKGRLNGFMFGGKLFGIAGGMAISGYFMQYHGIDSAMLAMLVLFAVPALASIAIRERPGEKLLPWMSGVASAEARAMKPQAWLPIIMLALKNLLRRDTFLVLILMLSYGVHQIFWEQGTTLFAAERLGWGEADLGLFGAAGNLVLGAFSLLLGGLLIDRFGPRRIAIYSSGAVLLTLGTLAGLSAELDSSLLFVVNCALVALPAILFYLVMLVLAMRVSVVEVAATSFALIVAVHALGTTLASSFLGQVMEMGGFPLMFGLAAFFLAMAGTMTLWMTHKTAGPVVAEDAGINVEARSIQSTEN